MRIASKWISIIVIVLTFLACKADSEYSRNYACHFIFYTQHGHVTQNKETSILNGILDSPGVFAKVSVKKLSGITHVIVVPNNGGKNEDIKLTTEVENNQITYSMGANNALLMGCDTNLQKVAFDGQCANCLENYSTSNFPLAWSDNGRTVTCAKCGRVYDLNANGICVKGDKGRALYKYRAFMATGYDGTATLNVVN